MYCNQKSDCNSGCSVQRVCLRPVPGPIGATDPTGPTGSLGQNPYDLYVQASAASGGDGTQLNPFQTLEQALNVVQPNGVINLLQGTYPVSQQIPIGVNGVTIMGRAGLTILLQAPIVLFLINGDNVTIDGLTMTSNIPYPLSLFRLVAMGIRY